MDLHHFHFTLTPVQLYVQVKPNPGHDSFHNGCRREIYCSSRSAAVETGNDANTVAHITDSVHIINPCPSFSF